MIKLNQAYTDNVGVHLPLITAGDGCGNAEDIIFLSDPRRMNYLDSALWPRGS